MIRVSVIAQLRLKLNSIMHINDNETGILLMSNPYFHHIRAQKKQLFPTIILIVDIINSITAKQLCNKANIIVSSILLLLFFFFKQSFFYNLQIDFYFYSHYSCNHIL